MLMDEKHNSFLCQFIFQDNFLKVFQQIILSSSLSSNINELMILKYEQSVNLSLKIFKNSSNSIEIFLNKDHHGDYLAKLLLVNLKSIVWNRLSRHILSRFQYLECKLRIYPTVVLWLLFTSKLKYSSLHVVVFSLS